MTADVEGSRRAIGAGSAPIAKTVLPNGLRIVSERIEGLASVAIGVWVENGSRYEEPARNGVSHFLEHLFFKGTARRTAAQISEEIDAVGGVLNADTDREHTCYYAKVLGDDVGLAIDLLSDIFLASRLDADEIAREKTVVLEEIAEIEDTPDDYIHDLFHLAYWPDHALGLPVCGTPPTVEAFDREACLRLIAERYRPNRIVVAAAGDIRHDDLVAEVARHFGGLTGTAPITNGPAPVTRSGVELHHRRLAQVQLHLATGGVSANDPARVAAAVLNATLGDSPSSRLFQEIRENRGLAYSIDSFLCSYRDTGYLGIAAGTRAAWVPEVVAAIVTELRRLRREGVTPAELARAKGKLKGSILLGLDGCEQRMERLAFDEMYHGRDVPLDEIAARIDAVGNDDVVALAERLFVPERCGLVLLGNMRTQPVDTGVFADLDRP
jgi:predicted Zn-dependent peptidase